MNCNNTKLPKRERKITRSEDEECIRPNMSTKSRGVGALRSNLFQFGSDINFDQGIMFH